MINHKAVQKIEQDIASIKCDICGKVYDADDHEIQEFHHIDFFGGYGSIFGNGTQVNCDMCQHCLHKMIDDSWRCSDART